jgi:gluconate 2-dehydrogenase gamma chain
MTDLRRRDLLTGTAFVLMGTGAARAGIVAGSLPWAPNASSPPVPAKQGPWLFFTAAEGATAEAIADRIIPPDPQTPGGKDAGCAVFIDRQLAGPYGRAEGLYDKGPFIKGSKTQGFQLDATPADIYRQALAAIDAYARSRGSSSFAVMSAELQDATLRGIEDGSIPLQGVDAAGFFESLVKDVTEGFFADPLYGGNRDMCGWKMIGYPGAHYDYREWVGRHNERYPHPPVSIMGRPGWTPKA